MDIQAYITSGIIESYVLGLANAEEIAEVNELSSQFVEVREAINEFSLAMEKKAHEYAVTPPPDLKLKLMAEIGLGIHPQAASPLTRPEEALLLHLSNMRTWRMVAAAGVILFIVSAALNYYLYNQYSDKKEAYQALLSERQTLQVNNDMYRTQLKEWQTAAAMIADPVMLMVKLKSVNGQDEAATVFWNTQNKDVFVLVNKLPDPKSGKQYQLWAMVNGLPVDAGMLNPNCGSVCKMKNIPEAQGFAITLEKEGGSSAPNLKAMRVSGNI